MHRIRKLGSALSTLACFAMVTSSAMARHVHFDEYVCFRDIDHYGDLDFDHGGYVHVHVNTKNGSLSLHGHSEVANRYCHHIHLHNVPGHRFCLPRCWGVVCDYHVDNHGCSYYDDEHDDHATLTGHGYFCEYD